MRFAVLCSVLGLAGSACLTPRSLSYQTMAAPLGRGATEVNVFGGFGYVSQTDPPISATEGAEPVTNQVQRRGFGLPAAEANIQHGLSDHVALNIHASSAGLQPGMKFTVNRSKVAHFALLPAVAFGYASVGSSTFQSHVDGRLTEVNPASTTSFSFLAGLKLLVSHRSGVYGGLGYDLLLHRILTTSAPSSMVDRTETLSVSIGHQISAAIGFDVALGRVHLRPEIAAAVYPGVSQDLSTRVGSTQSDRSVNGGFGWAIMPGLGISVASDPLPDEPDETAVDENDGEDDEERARRVRKRHTLEEEEDEENRLKRRQVEEE